MIEIGAFEAKTKLAELLRMVENEGEEIIITRNGKKIARLCAIEEKQDALLILEEIKNISKNINMKDSEIKIMIDDVRK